MKDIKLWILIFLIVIMMWPHTLISNDSFIEVPKEKFEVIAELPSYNLVGPNYIRWNFIQLKENSYGIILVRKVDGIGDSCFLLELYDIEKKEIIRDIFLGTDEELREEDSGVIAISDIVVDSENKVYVGIRDNILVFSKELQLFNILTNLNLKS